MSHTSAQPFYVLFPNSSRDCDPRSHFTSDSQPKTDTHTNILTARCLIYRSLEENYQDDGYRDPRYETFQLKRNSDRNDRKKKETILASSDRTRDGVDMLLVKKVSPVMTGPRHRHGDQSNSSGEGVNRMACP